MASKTEYFDVPNLDDFSNDPTDYAALEVVFLSLSRYAQFKKRSMRSRLTGDMGHAVLCEKEMERIYNQLPSWARW
jgi:hypothetical protein